MATSTSAPLKGVKKKRKKKKFPRHITPMALTSSFCANIDQETPNRLFPPPGFVVRDDKVNKGKADIMQHRKYASCVRALATHVLVV